MNVKLNINKKSAKAHFKCKSFLNDAKKQHIFAETCLDEAVGSLPVMPSLLPHVLWGRSQVSLFFCKCGEPCIDMHYNDQISSILIIQMLLNELLWKHS